MARIYIVDDVTDIRYAVRAGLEPLGHEVIEAENGDEAYRRLDEVRPDIIFMDVMMPGTNGLDIVAKLKNDDRYKHIPVVIITAKTDGITIDKSTTLADALLEKPFEMQQVQDLITSLLRH